jgi:hypothetical protein
MEIINQLAAPLAQSAQVARTQTTEKTQQIRRAQVTRKNVAAGQSDTFEHTVESTEATAPIHDEQRREPQQPPRGRKPKRPARPTGAPTDPPPTIDVTA